MKIKFSLLSILLICTINTLIGHGISVDTFIRISNKRINTSNPAEGWINILQLQTQMHIHGASYIKTWCQSIQSYRHKPVQVTSDGQTNCHMQLIFSSNHHNNLRCTPDQLFYVLPQDIQQKFTSHQKHCPAFIDYDDNQRAINSGYWAQACTLQKGQILLRENWDGRGAGIVVTQVNFQAKPLEIYNLDVADDHTYLVTTYNIVTHNSHLGPVLSYNNVTKGCEAAVATGIFAGLASWLGGFGLSASGEGLLTFGISTTVGTPVLIAVGTLGAGLMAWQAFSWFGHKHVKQSSQFKIPQIHNIWANLNPPNLPCGASGAKSTEIAIPTCEAQKILHNNAPVCGGTTQLPKEPVTNCKSTQVKDTKIIACPSAQQNYVANDLSTEKLGLEESSTKIFSEPNSTELSDEDIKKIIKKFTDKTNESTKKRSKLFVNENGNIVEANKDFDSMPLSNIKNLPQINGKTGKLNSEWNVTVREKSEDTRPTLEFYNFKNKKRIKIRYGSK